MITGVEDHGQEENLIFLTALPHLRHLLGTFQRNTGLDQQIGWELPEAPHWVWAELCLGIEGTHCQKCHPGGELQRSWAS